VNADLSAAPAAAELAAGAEGFGESHALFHVFGLPVTSAITTMWAIMVVLVVLLWMVGRRFERIPRSRAQSAVELGIEAGLSAFEGIFRSRERAMKYMPLLGSLFVFILASNYTDLLPGAGELTGFKPPTTRWGVTAGLAAVVFFSTHYFGIKEKGIGYFKHFFEPVFLAPLMFPLTIVEELVKPFSLSLRLFANIFGGETVLLGLLLAVPYFLPITTLFLELIFGFVQALIFTMLSAVYFANATAGHEA